MKQLAIRLGHQTTTAKSPVILKLLGAVAALTLSTYVSAVGMGGINVTSALGQPLKADIELVAVNQAEKSSLVARIASPDVYKGAGLEYPYGNKFKFEIESKADGAPYIRASSAQPINDPFVSLLVELNWSSGRLLREYTFLLDPPGYVPEQPAPAEVHAVMPAAPAAPAEAVPKPAEQAMPATAPAEEKPVLPAKRASPIEKPAKQATGKPAATMPGQAVTAQTPEKTVTGDITVKRGDTLGRIAKQNKPDNVSLEQMLVALYRANADQFDGKNMNRIRAGKILRLPDQNELAGVAQQDAVKEIRAQVADWNAYRQKLAGAATTSKQPQEAKQVTTGKIASSVADKAPVAKESAKEVLKLSKGEAPGDKATAVGGKPVTAQDKKNAAQENAIAKDKALKEDQARTALLEKNLKDMKRLAELKSEAAVLAQAAKPEAASAPAAAEKVKSVPLDAASGVKPAPVAKPKPQMAPPPEPSLVDEILGEPLYLAGGAAVLLGLGGLGFMLSRRRRAPAAIAKQGEDAGTTAGHITVPVAPSPETGDFTGMVATRTDETSQPDDVDPISEADLFLNFGRDAQAEEVLKEALKKTPNNHQIHLKLLGIYANRKDVNSFSVIARQLQDSNDDEAWQQAAAMGRKLDPGNPMYGIAGTVEDADSATMQTPALNAMPDFVLDDTPATQATSAPGMDFDLGAPAAEASPESDFTTDSSKTTILSAADMKAAQTGPMDFDITATTAPASDTSGIDFDITAATPDTPMAMDFDITSHVSDVPKVTEETETALPNLDDLIFDVTAARPSAPAAQPEADDHAATSDRESNAGTAFTLDFPVTATEEQTAPEEPKPVEFGLADISLNLDEATPEPGEPTPENRDEHWHEVATKLDLAKAYQEMGDMTGAREILEEVLREGDAGQQAAAQAILDQLG